MSTYTGRSHTCWAFSITLAISMSLIRSLDFGYKPPWAAVLWRVQREGRRGLRGAGEEDIAMPASNASGMSACCSYLWALIKLRKEVSNVFAGWNGSYINFLTRSLPFVAIPPVAQWAICGPQANICNICTASGFDLCGKWNLCEHSFWGELPNWKSSSSCNMIMDHVKGAETVGQTDRCTKVHRLVSDELDFCP